MVLAGALGGTWALGCDEDTDEGSGAHGTGGAATGSGSGVFCQLFCERGVEFECISGIDACIDQCESRYAESPMCSAELSAYLQCLIASSTSCDIPPACVSAFTTHEQCVVNAGFCPGFACSGGSEGSCSCEGSCAGLDLAVQCSPGPSGGFNCQCLEGGGIVGSCVESSAPCSFDSGCCASFFFD